MERTDSIIAGMRDSLMRNRDAIIASAGERRAAKGEGASDGIPGNVLLHTKDMLDIPDIIKGLDAANDDIGSAVKGKTRAVADDYGDPESGAGSRASSRAKKAAPAEAPPEEPAPPRPAQKDLMAAMDSLHVYVSERIEEVAQAKAPLTPQQVQGYLSIMEKAAKNLNGVRSHAESYLRDGMEKPYDVMADIFGDMAVAAKMLEDIQDSHQWRTQEQAAYRSDISRQCSQIAMDAHNRKMQIIGEMNQQRSMTLGMGMPVTPMGMAPYGAPVGGGYGAVAGVYGQQPGGYSPGVGQPGIYGVNTPPCAPGMYADPTMQGRGYRTV